MSKCKPCCTPVDISSISMTSLPSFIISQFSRGCSIPYFNLEVFRMRHNKHFYIWSLRASFHRSQSHHSIYSRHFTPPLIVYVSSTLALTAYFDDDWGGCLDTRLSISIFYLFLVDNHVSWTSTRRHTIPRSSVEAEYDGLVNVVERTSRRNVLLELYISLTIGQPLCFDTVSVYYLSVKGWKQFNVNKPNMWRLTFTFSY